MRQHRNFRGAALLLGLVHAAGLGAETRTYAYQYDDSGRLVEVRTEPSVITYTYDDAGNIVDRSGGPNLQIFASGCEGVAP